MRRIDVKAIAPANPYWADHGGDNCESKSAQLSSRPVALTLFVPANRDVPRGGRSAQDKRREVAPALT